MLQIKVGHHNSVMYMKSKFFYCNLLKTKDNLQYYCIFSVFKYYLKSA